MKKSKPEEPVEQNGWACVRVFFIIVFGMWVSIWFLSWRIGHMDSKIDETNRFLSTFQRVDTVKEERHDKLGDQLFCASISVSPEPNGQSFCTSWVASPGCDKGYVMLNGQCVQTIGKDKRYRFESSKVDGDKDIQALKMQDDPNLCKQWKTICEDGPVGPQCDVKCTLDLQ